MLGLAESLNAAPEKKAVSSASAPDEDELRRIWPALAQMYASKPRLNNMLATSKLEFDEADGKRIVRFEVVNDAQKEWVETKLLHELEGNIRKISGSDLIILEVKVAETVKDKEMVYMPSDKAKVLMANNEEVKNLVKDFSLDIK